ncbi:Uncharacterized membrane protein [Cohaesibacter gelatinilyticus]|uniref:Uncharacterized membrane protein n=2 Tax=Cohaesibacter gelatinilyticus TaxID=372072 RepID=A0A285NGA6_9HYPH|nr:Uncharacterized membrane protein [Cohaesibacter gelatinilyticus]
MLCCLYTFLERYPAYWLWGNIMRSLPDRIRHMVLFEFIAIGIAAVVGSFLLGYSLKDFGILSVMLSALAMSWNLVFNWVFDHWYHRKFGYAKRTVKLRIAHSLLFEAGMLFLGVWIVMWWLGIGFWTAMLLDIGFAVFFLVYAFVFNWVYDVVFPVQKKAVEPAISEV